MPVLDPAAPQTGGVASQATSTVVSATQAPAPQGWVSWLRTPFSFMGRMLGNAANALYNVAKNTVLFAVGSVVLLVRLPFRAVAWVGSKVSRLFGSGAAPAPAATAQQPAATEQSSTAPIQSAAQTSFVSMVASAVVNAPRNFVNMVIAAPGNFLQDVRSFFGGNVAAAAPTVTAPVVAPRSTLTAAQRLADDLIAVESAIDRSEREIEAGLRREVEAGLREVTGTTAATSPGTPASTSTNTVAKTKKGGVVSHLFTGWNKTPAPQATSTAPQGGTGPQAGVLPAPERLAGGRPSQRM